MLAAFDSLLMDNYHAYILTVELSYTVAIYCLPNGWCKILSKFNCFETKYEVAFLRCLCDLKHKSTSEIAVNWKKEERNLHFNGLREKIRTSFKLF